MTTNSQHVDNGVNVAALLQARQAMTDVPEAARFQFRAVSEWIDGIHTRIAVRDFFGVGGEQQHRQTFTFDSDHPELFAAADNGAAGIEMVLVSLAACLTGGIAAVATHRGIELRSVRATITGDIDLRGMLGVDSEVRNGYSGIQVHFEVDANATRAEIEALVAQSQKRSAVYDVIANPTNVVVDVV